LEAIRTGAGDDTFLLACGCPFGPAIGIVDAMRIGPDTAPSWKPYFNWLPWISPFIKNEASAPSLRNALRHTLNLSVLHKRWWWNDPDCLLVRDTQSRLTQAEVQSAVTLVGLSGGMFVSSDDPSKLTDERLHWISMLVPNVGLRGRALDLLARDMPEIYQVQVHACNGDYTLLGLFNWDAHPGECRVNLESLGFAEGCDLELFDFWNERYFRTPDMQVSFPALAPHGSLLLRIGLASDVPHIVGSNLHISGGAEFTVFEIQEGILRIETLDFNRWVSGSLFLWLPVPPASATCNAQPIEVIRKGDHLYILQLHFLGRARIELVL
jgi:alpha-galactosidase